jgi:hypothetical protein
VAGKPTATICSRHLRTLNVNASCGAPDDWYYYSPWRAPGAAPVLDSCGMASGHLPPTPKQNFGGAYVNTSHAKVGDKGSGLPPAPSGTVWSPGMSYEVSWTIEANVSSIPTPPAPSAACAAAAALPLPCRCHIWYQ